MNGSLSSSTRNHNGEHRKHAQITLDNARTNNMANKSTSTSDLRDNVQNKSTSTEDLSLEDRVTRRTSSVQTSNAKTQESTKMITCQLLNDELRSCSLQQRRELFKTNSSPNILEGI